MASITRFDAGGVAIFAPAGAGAAAGISYTDYEHEEDLAAAATYTPPVDTIFCWQQENIGAGVINMQWYDSINAAWTLNYIDEYDEKWLYSQSTSQRLRMENGAGAAQAVGLYGVTWSGYAAYEYEADLAAAGTTYTPPVQTFFSVFAEFFQANIVTVEWYDSVNLAWSTQIFEKNELHRLHQSASQRFRVVNDDAANARAIGLYGETWS